VIALSLDRYTINPVSLLPSHLSNFSYPLSPPPSLASATYPPLLFANHLRAAAAKTPFRKSGPLSSISPLSPLTSLRLSIAPPSSTRVPFRIAYIPVFCFRVLYRLCSFFLCVTVFLLLQLPTSLFSEFGPRSIKQSQPQFTT